MKRAVEELVLSFILPRGNGFISPARMTGRLKAFVAKAVDEAIDAETDACARLADECAKCSMLAAQREVARHLAAAIRKRKQQRR